MNGSGIEFLDEWYRKAESILLDLHAFPLHHPRLALAHGAGGGLLAWWLRIAAWLPNEIPVIQAHEKWPDNTEQSSQAVIERLDSSHNSPAKKAH